MDIAGVKKCVASLWFGNGRGRFFQYLREIEHASFPCFTSNPDLPFSANDRSTTYKGDWLEEKVDALMETAEKVGQYFKIPLYAKKLQIRPINSITDKK